MKERLELIRAMKESPNHLGEGECDYVPPLELVGIFVAHSAISRMHYRGELDTNSAVFLNAAIGAHAFCVLHHCTHESISQHNSEHEKFENMVFRLANLIVFFDDGYKVAHRKHHQRTNQENDPDAILSHTELPVLGTMLLALGGKTYGSIGAPITANEATRVHKFGLGPVFASNWVQDLAGMIEWDNMTMKMASYKALEVFASHKNYKKVSETLETTWKDAQIGAYFVLSLFFSRYPHRNGETMENEVDSFYNNTYRGEGQVDLWMMGEGPHHLHHAKSDVSYALLPKVSDDIDKNYPHLSTEARGNSDLYSLENTDSMPRKRTKNALPSQQHGWERTCEIRKYMEILGEDSVEAVKGFAKVAIENAIRCCNTSDKELLRTIHRRMKLAKGPGFWDGFYGWFSSVEKRGAPFHSFADSVLSDATAEGISSKREFIVDQVLEVAKSVGEKVPNMTSGEEIKSHYFDFFVALADTYATLSEQELFLNNFLNYVGGETAAKGFNYQRDRIAIIERVRHVLESRVPSDMLKGDFDINLSKSTEGNVRKRIAEMIIGPRASL